MSARLVSRSTSYSTSGAHYMLAVDGDPLNNRVDWGLVRAGIGFAELNTRIISTHGSDVGELYLCSSNRDWIWTEVAARIRQLVLSRDEDTADFADVDDFVQRSREAFLFVWNETTRIHAASGGQLKM